MVGDEPASYLTAGDGPLVLLLHGTYWSRVWLPMLDGLATGFVRWQWTYRGWDGPAGN